MFMYVTFSLLLLNKKSANTGQTPLDLCPDPNLRKTLTSCRKENEVANDHSPESDQAVASTSSTSATNAASAISAPSTSSAASAALPVTPPPQSLPPAAEVVSSSKHIDPTTLECLVCSDAKRDTLFRPCGHICCCNGCAARVKKCLVCRACVTSRMRVGECVVCSEAAATVVFRPCGDVCACASCAPLMRKCVECRVPLQPPHSIQQHGQYTHKCI
ncbi:unnamed protein product [Diatraea saccharalis]|uniref:RING-type domain-containing protein n=1 Tax=Diatraea saccharalis TaxID=40085 RepID=A0A9N9QVR2_9NEOP|nr:unnamed protein product [Diatraea saccharalis]